MLLEVGAALALGALVLWLVFEPLFGSGKPELALLEPEAPEETRRGTALLALKEIEFDRATGKLSDRDYLMLKSRYSAEAVAALEAEQKQPAESGTGDAEALVAARLRSLRSARATGQPVPPSCPHCGPRPEPNALFCSRCGLGLGAAGYCADCGAPLPPESRFCARCGHRVAA